jgi:hypothetical protein
MLLNVVLALCWCGIAASITIMRQYRATAHKRSLPIDPLAEL